VQRRRALWRIFFIRLQMPMMSDNTSAQNKLAKYQVIYEETGALSGS
jgi:hypothetical protein